MDILERLRSLSTRWRCDVRTYMIVEPVTVLHFALNVSPSPRPKDYRVVTCLMTSCRSYRKGLMWHFV